MSAYVHAGFTAGDIPVRVSMTGSGEVLIDLDDSFSVLLDVATATNLARQILAATGGES